VETFEWVVSNQSYGTIVIDAQAVILKALQEGHVDFLRYFLASPCYADAKAGIEPPDGSRKEALLLAAVKSMKKEAIEFTMQRFGVSISDSEYYLILERFLLNFVGTPEHIALWHWLESSGFAFIRERFLRYFTHGLRYRSVFHQLKEPWSMSSEGLRLLNEMGFDIEEYAEEEEDMIDPFRFSRFETFTYLFEHHSTLFSENKIKVAVLRGEVTKVRFLLEKYPQFNPENIRRAVATAVARSHLGLLDFLYEKFPSLFLELDFIFNVAGSEFSDASSEGIRWLIQCGLVLRPSHYFMAMNHKRMSLFRFLKSEVCPVPNDFLERIARASNFSDALKKELTCLLEKKD